MCRPRRDNPASPELRAFFLARLRRFAALACDPRGPFAPRPRRLAARATVSAYQDCVALGIGPEARRVVDRALFASGWRGGFL